LLSNLIDSRSKKYAGTANIRRPLSTTHQARKSKPASIASKEEEEEEEEEHHRYHQQRQ
jgi:hypothetical protein